MNPYKKIARLEKKIETLSRENEALRLLQKENEKQKAEYEMKLKLLSEKEAEYYTLMNTLNLEKETYQDLVHKLKFKLKTMNTTYKKAFHEIAKDIGK